MSDGPYCSPGLARHWRTVVNRAARPACSDVEVEEAMKYALARDYGGLSVPLRRPSMFISDETVTGSFGRILIQQKQRIANGQLPSLESDRQALAAGLSAQTASQIRSVVEHSLGKRQLAETQRLVARLRSVASACDFGLLAAEFVSGSASSARLPRLRKRSGVDEGPRV